MKDFLRDLSERFLNRDTGEIRHIALTVVLVFGILVAIGALTVLIISLVKLKKNKRANAFESGVLPDGVNSRAAFYETGDISKRRTVIGPEMPYMPDSFSEQKTVVAPSVSFENAMPANQPAAAQPGGVPYANMANMEGRTVSVREMNREGTPVQPSYPYAQTPRQDDQAAGVNSTVNVRGQMERPATQVERYSYAQPQGSSGIGELMIRYTLPGRGEQTQRFVQPQEITIGRAIGNKLVLPYETVSSHHARIDCVGGEVFITNVSAFINGSQNILTVDRRDVTQRTKLPNGCQINLGMVPITVTWTAGNAAPATDVMNDLDGMTVRPGIGVNDDWNARGDDGMLIVSWELVGRRGSKRVNLQDSVIIGRDPADTVHIEDPTRTVSKHHLIVTHDNNGQLVVRNGSHVNPQYGKNPFFVSGQCVVDEIPFTDGMTIKAGQAMITLTREEGA